MKPVCTELSVSQDEMNAIFYTEWGDFVGVKK